MRKRPQTEVDQLKRRIAGLDKKRTEQDARIKELEAENSRLSSVHARVNDIWLKVSLDRSGSVTRQFYAGVEFMAKKVLNLLEGREEG